MASNNQSKTLKMFLQPRMKDKKIILNALGYFDGFQVGASLPATDISFIQNIGKPFFVDPMAYMFALPPEQAIGKETGKVRPSLLSLARKYGPTFERAIGKRAVVADEILHGSGPLEEFTYNALEYQRTKFHSDDLLLFSGYYDYSKYDALEGASGSAGNETRSMSPDFLLPPFFLIQSAADPWYQVTLRCARIATEHTKEGERLFPVLFLKKELLLDTNFIRSIAQDFSNSGVDGMMIWINGMSEESSSPELLAGLVRLVNSLSSNGTPVIKFFGGFFSILMHAHGIAAFTGNLSYKTSRDILAYKWIAPAPPKPKFYIPDLHQAYDLEQALEILSEFPFLACRCGVCRVAYGEDLNYFVAEMGREGYCQNHFLNVRRREIEFIAKNGMPAALAVMDETLRSMKRKNARGARHLMKWRNVMGAAIDVGAGAELLARVGALPATLTSSA